MAALFMSSTLLAEATPSKPPDRALIVRAARVLDVRTGTYFNSAAIWIENERIKAVGPTADVLKQADARSRGRDGSSRID
jgi:imidazolonepropionase-like amidohydrolase